MDDFAYFEDSESKVGYLTSNREGGKGYDDIYQFYIQKCKQILAGTVYDVDTKNPISQAKVTLLTEDNNVIKQVVSDSKGGYTFDDLNCEQQYLVRASKEEYATQEKRIKTGSSNKKNIIDLELKRDQIILNPCDDLAKLLDIPIIHFDFDKYNIRPDAQLELQKVLAVLNKYPSMEIDIRSHTDCRGSDTYNEVLSENRAQSTKKYLIDNGIDPKRLTAKGYGEYRLLNNCDCKNENDNCSKEQHQANRRSEFIVTSFKGNKCDYK
ncbi:OmpA family protein [Tenacibaculum tangerinum]|uniref:OmpA family protein n=1 Tax=Tenacibaculum tangerinum TaxID=3038772 RepID=A0ABY8L658_9FLAO|nr:OmpA family protein [Tenacibaculum tangerinum]WGH76591.1 OmpA family protein [Tenacibaculum tangerinum]